MISPVKKTLWPDVSLIQSISEHQRSQLTVATSGRFGCLHGGAGTGKTRSTRELIRTIKKHSPSLSIGLAAPTGKAALRMMEMLHEVGLYLTATTIHTLLSVGRNGHDGSGWGFQHNEENPLQCDILFVDETSMVSNDLMASLLRALPPHCHVLFVGDPNQLPPVGAGRPFADFIQLGVPTGHLTEIHRFAGRIADVCHKINAGQHWEPSPRIDLDAEFPENLRHVETRKEPQQIDTIVETVGKLRDNRGFDPAEDIQVLCATNRFRERINKILRDEFNKTGERISGCDFAIGDKVICTRNQRFEVDTGKANPPLRYTANGEIGRIADIDKKFVSVRMPEGQNIKVTRGGWSDLELAYAITVWKSQGSQWPVVIPAIEDSFGADMICDRAYHYTGYSRASKLSISVGSRAAVDRQCKKTSSANRKTLLVETVKEMRNSAMTAGV